MPFSPWRLWVGLLTAAVWLVPAQARAEDPIERFSRLLRESEDFRVRTQAALALGASKAVNAVTPLCGGLEDGSAAVRVAAATALRRLRLGGGACLAARLAVEDNQLAKAAMSRALEAVAGEAAGAPAVITDDTRFYVALGTVNDLPGRPSGAADVWVGGAMRRAAGKAFAFAPRGETPKEAAKLLAKHSALKPFYLAPKLTLVNASGTLSVKIDVAMFSYPGKALLGSFSVRAAQSGVEAEDKKASEDLIRAVAEGAIQKFAKAAAQL